MDTLEDAPQTQGGKHWTAKGILFVVVLAIFAITGGAYTYWHIRYNDSYRASAPEIQSHIDKFIPRTVDVKLPNLATRFLPKSVSKEITVSKIAIELRDDKAFAHIEASATEFNRQIEAVAEAEGTVRYDGERGSFFFHPTNVDIKQLTADGQDLEEKVETKAADLSGKLTDKLSHSKLGAKLLEKLPQELLDPDSLKLAIHEYMEHSIREGTTVVLDKVPLYTLKDEWKQQAAKHMIYTVKIENNHVVIEFSILKLAGWALGVVVTFFALVALFVFCCALAIMLGEPLFLLGLAF